MATLTAASRIQNIEKSLNVYVTNELIVGLGFTVILPRAERVGSLPIRWVQVDYIPLSDLTAVKRSNSGRLGARTAILVNANCFEEDDARLSGNATIYTLTALVDDVKAIFAPNVAIPVQDYDTGGNPLVGGLIGESFPDSTPVPTAADSGVTQVNVSATLRYVTESIE